MDLEDIPLSGNVSQAFLSELWKGEHVGEYDSEDVVDIQWAWDCAYRLKGQVHPSLKDIFLVLSDLEDDPEIFGQVKGVAERAFTLGFLNQMSASLARMSFRDHETLYQGL